MRALLLAASLTAIVSGATVFGGGLAAVAVSPDGKHLAVGGQNRVVYLIDAEKTEVKSRFWLGVRIARLAFNKSGTRLVVADEIDQLHLLDVASGKVLARVAQVGGLAAFPASNLAVVRDLASFDRPRLRLLSLDTLKDLGEIELHEIPVVWRFSIDGKRLIVLETGQRTTEPVVEATEVPRDLRGLARWTFRQKNDGRESRLLDVDVATGKIVRETSSWFTSDTDSTHLVRLGDETFVFNRLNHCAKIGPKGDTTAFETSQGTNYALATSSDGKLLYTGGLGGGAVGPVAEGMRTAFKLDELPGQSEFVTRFDVLSDGSAWAVTSAFRLVKISRAGRIEKTIAVY